MGIPQLDNLVRIRQLKTETPAQAELDGLIRSGNARLQDARVERHLDVDRSLVEALIRVTTEVASRVAALK